MQEAALTCKAEELDQNKGIVYVHGDLATAERQLSYFEVLIECARTPITQREDQHMSGMAEHMSIAHHKAINRDQIENDH